VGSLALIATSTVLVYAFDKATFSLTTLVETVVFSIFSAAIVGAAVAGSVKFIIETVPISDRLAASNEVREKVRNALADFSQGQTVQVDKLFVRLEAKAKEASK
jgi:hypothetical protein